MGKVESYKYLGLIINDQLTWKVRTDNVIKKVYSCLYCLRKLKSFHVRIELLHIVGTFVICSTRLFWPSVLGWEHCKAGQAQVEQEH